MTFSTDLFWSFRSPYSYLATSRIVAATREYDLAVRFRPVYPLAVRQLDFFDRVDRLMPKYVFLDSKRSADYLGLVFEWPDPDPIRLEGDPPHASDKQPFIHRLTRLGVAADRRGQGLAFADEISRLLFGGTKDWDQGSHMGEAAARAGLDLAELDAAVEADANGHEEEIQTNQAALRTAGHWGVPTLIFEGEPFFGQDRIDHCVWRMKQKGLAARS